MGLFSWFGKRGARDEEADETAASPERDEHAEPAAKEHGPWDAAEAPEGVERLDFGALKLPSGHDCQVQLAIDRKARIAMGAIVQSPNAAMQINLYAAPKTGELWPDIREELVESVASQGGTATYREGPFGPEIEARIPRKDVAAVRHVRYVGIDGPRWLLRATIEGVAVTSTAEREKLYEVLRGTVVERGTKPHPVRDLLTLTVPKSAEARLEEELGVPQLPKRGPEITEIR
ncbi:MAG: DUF3710 domain-containing protein [Flaviflexus sp.]|nr:DUF3710 domain-containing protein [Flaviflexus sp.]